MGARELGPREKIKYRFCVALAVFARVHEDHVETRLVAVHGVEDDLWGGQAAAASLR